MKARTSDALFGELVEALEQSIRYSKGELTLRTTVLPEPPPVPKPKQILQLRERFKMSQSIFAAALNVAPKTVQAWEQGQRVPSHASVRLLQIFEKEPEVVARTVGGVATNTKAAMSIAAKKAPAGKAKAVAR